ncbi:MAG: BspA family leucine-rich repeat surface protein [Flavobacteriaceae bacterium]|nr:BspA family leucine-rich repeat surface protein [Flavobacteriaceae bacterium]
MKIITFLLLFSFSINTLLAQDFYLNSNGVTCMCPDASVGDTGVVNSVTYTKRTRQQITTENASTTCTSGITDMSSLFNQVIFNEDISSWDVSNVTNMNQMFAESYAFNQPIGYWDVSSVTNMNGLFFFTTAFNQPINDWNVSSVTDMGGMFIESGFNQPLDAWDVSNVTSMFTMFYAALAFNQSLDTWDVSNVGNMQSMFTNTPFNQDISSWDVGNVVNMKEMFTGTSFNQPLDNWDVSSVINMYNMFNGNSSFNQDLSTWIFNSAVNLVGMLNSTIISVENYDLLLSSMYDQPLVNKEFGDFSLSYCNVTDHDALINDKGWTFDGGQLVVTDIIAPENGSVEVDIDFCFATGVNLGNPDTFGCGNLSVENNAPVEFPLGITEVIWTLTDGNGTSVTDTQIIEVFMVTDEASLCYVSADENQPENNQIFITSNTDLNGQNVDFHEVLRESSSGNYETIGFIVPPEESFIDITSDNNTQAYRYKVQTTNVCGQVLMLSDYHKTILLQSNIATDNSVNLSWSPYIGFSFDSYAIYRNVNGTNFDLLTTLASTNTSYNDSAADVVNNSYEYYIAIEAPNCNTVPLMSEFIKSNIEYINPNLGISELSYLEKSISLFPNPTSNQVAINTSNDIDIIRVELYNVLGQQINIVTKSTIEMSYLPSGLYYLQISTDLGTVTKTIIRK